MCNLCFSCHYSSPSPSRSGITIKYSLPFQLSIVPLSTNSSPPFYSPKRLSVTEKTVLNHAHDVLLSVSKIASHGHNLYRIKNVLSLSLRPGQTFALALISRRKHAVKGTDLEQQNERKPFSPLTYFSKSGLPGKPLPTAFSVALVRPMVDGKRPNAATAQKKRFPQRMVFPVFRSILCVYVCAVCIFYPLLQNFHLVPR